MRSSHNGRRNRSEGDVDLGRVLALEGGERALVPDRSEGRRIFDRLTHEEVLEGLWHALLNKRSEVSARDLGMSCEARMSTIVSSGFGEASGEALR